MSLFEELKRRNVFRVAIAYGVVAWLALQIADVMIDNIGAPDWLFGTILMVLAIGFPVVLVFAWAFELTPEGIKREHEVDRSDSITNQTGRRLDRTIIVVLVLAVGYLLFDKLGPDSEPTESAPEVAASSGDTATEDVVPEPGTAAPVAASVAVLPFVNMSNDPDNEYFSDGLTDTLLHMLAQLPELRVAARTSSFSFKGENRPVGEIAQVLGVANILEGSVQRAGGQVRVTAQLIRADDGFHVWSETYTRPLEDIFAIQDEIATDVADALDVALLGGTDAPRHPDTEDIGAYDLYLRGLEQRAITSYASLGAAESLFKQAISMDPGFVDAKLALAVNYLMQQHTGLIPAEAVQSLVPPLIQQAREQEPDNRLARAVELAIGLSEEAGWVLTNEEIESAASELLQLLPLLPEQSFLRGQVAMGYGFGLGRFDQALDIIEAGLLLDPLSAELYAQQGNLYLGLERPDDARRSFQRAMELEPANPNHYSRMARAAAELGDLQGMFTWRLRHVQLDPQDHEVVATLAGLFYAWGLLEEGDLWAERVRALAPNSDFVQRLRIDRAVSADDAATIITTAEEMLRQPATMRHGVYPTALFEWLQAMSTAGRSSEAEQFLLTLNPDLATLEQPPTEPQGVLAQYVVVELMARTRPREEALSAWDRYLAARAAYDMQWADEPYTRMVDGMLRDDLQLAVESALEDLSEPLASWPQRTRAYRDPFLSPITSDPRVASRLSELDREYRQGQEVIRDLVDSEDWNP